MFRHWRSAVKRRAVHYDLAMLKQFASCRLELRLSVHSMNSRQGGAAHPFEDRTRAFP